jgi:hypothetical protein
LSLITGRVRDKLRLYGTVPSGPTAQTWKLPFAGSIASMSIFAVISVPSTWFQGSQHAIRDAAGWGIRRVS